MMSKTTKRLRSVLLTVLFVAATNFAVSSVITLRSGVAQLPDVPKPRSGVAQLPDVPKPKSGVAQLPDVPKPKSGVAQLPDVPKP